MEFKKLYLERQLIQPKIINFQLEQWLINESGYGTMAGATNYWNGVMAHVHYTMEQLMHLLHLW